MYLGITRKLYIYIPQDAIDEWTVRDGIVVAMKRNDSI